MPGKVQQDLIDLRAFYEQSNRITDADELRQLCHETIRNSVGTQANKDRFHRLLKETGVKAKMLKYITNYSLSGQGLGVVKW